MTTIAYRDGVMSADTMDIFCDTKHFGMIKVRQGMRSLCGFAGAVRQMPQVFDWVSNCETNTEHPNTWSKLNVEDCDKFDAILVVAGSDYNKKTGRPPRTHPTIYRIAIGGVCIEYNDKPQFIAIGTGAVYALGAMHAGASAPQAVAAAIRYDLCSGGKVSTIEFDHGHGGGGYEHA